MSKIFIETLDGGSYPYKWLNPPERLGDDSYSYSDWEVSFNISDTEWVEIGTFSEEKAKKLHAKLLKKISSHLNKPREMLEELEKENCSPSVYFELLKAIQLEVSIPLYIKISDLLKEIKAEETTDEKN